MAEKKHLFSHLPKVDELLAHERVENSQQRIPREVIVETIREEIEGLRQSIINNEMTLETLKNALGGLIDRVLSKAQSKLDPKLKRVINGTGTIIHTNLGRALIDEDIMAHVAQVASHYSNLEYDLEAGKRGSRYSHIEDILRKITGAEAALVVNNNAAAVMLVLGTLGKGKEVVVSRGELVEIGGSFRVPDVMEASGAKLVDIGATNKTHLRDYQQAIGEETAALLKVHTSNYRIVGFTSGVELEELVQIGQENAIPVVEDIGSGVLIDLSKYGLEYEPTVQSSIKAGVDVLTFSGDKLLGGPQAGIIIGKKKYIDQMKKNPLTRAIRVDKFTIAALEATLRLYLNEEEAIKKIPTLHMLTMPFDCIEDKANELAYMIKEQGHHRLDIAIVDQVSQVGGGAMPLEELPTKALMLSSDELDVAKIELGLRTYNIPIITRIYKDKLYIDVRTVDKKDFHHIVAALQTLEDRI